MLRSRISRANSKLEIFIGIVDCRQKKIPIIFKISFTWFAFHIFYQLHFQAKISSFLSPYSPMPLRFRTPVSSLPMMPSAERLIFFMGFGFFQGFEVSNSDTWDQNIFSIYKTFKRYFWLQNAHKPNTKMQWFLITIVRRFFFLI